MLFADAAHATSRNPHHPNHTRRLPQEGPANGLAGTLSMWRACYYNINRGMSRSLSGFLAIAADSVNVGTETVKSATESVLSRLKQLCRIYTF